VARRAATTLARRRGDGGQRPSLLERLNPARTEKGGRIGDVADKVLSKMGTGGKLASAVSAGSRIVERMRAGDDGSAGEAEAADAGPGPAQAVASEGNGFGPHQTVPIQESIEVAVSPRAAFSLCTRFEEYPEFLDRVESVERVDESHARFVVKARGRHHELDVEVVDRRPNQRLDWRCTEGIEHAGVISFHELAPRLTHIELTVELEPEGIVERLTRSSHLTERAIRTEMHRFKAYAELWGEEPDDEEEPEDEEELEEEEPDEELEPEKEPEDEEEFEEEEEPVAEGEEDFEDEDEDFEDEEEYEDEEELEGEEELDEDEDLEDEEEEFEEEPLTASG
jgi:uncharacterized membrane protein